MEVEQKLRTLFSDYWYDLVSLTPNLVTGAVVFLIFGFIGFAIGRLWRSRLRRSEEKRVISEFVGNLTIAVFVIIGFFLFLQVMGFNDLAGSLIAGAGIGTLVFGFAFKDIAENFLAGIIIAFNRPFNAGEIIEIDKFKGTVKTISLRTTHIRTADGQDIYLPNSLILKSPVSNYTQDGFLRYDFEVGLDTGADVVNARVLIQQVLAAEPAVLKTPVPYIIVNELGVSTLNLKVLFWLDVNINKTIPAGILAETIKSRMIRETRDILFANGYTLPASILEHKIYDKTDPIPLKMVE